MNNSPSNLRNRIEEVSHETDNRLNNLQKELDDLEEQLYLWEDIPDEDLWEDGEIKKDEVFDKINYHLFVQGDWKLMRRKDG